MYLMCLPLTNAHKTSFWPSRISGVHVSRALVPDKAKRASDSHLNLRLSMTSPDKARSSELEL